jgi:hypothetical protein
MYTKSKKGKYKMGTIVDILIANNAKEPLFHLNEVSIVKNKGIVGDRYFYEVGSFSQRLKDKQDFSCNFY